MPLPALMTAGTLTPFGSAVLSGGLQVFQGILGHKGKQQQYMNQLAYKEANDEYAQWAAGMQAKQTNLNNSFKYWQEQVNYGQQLNFANGMRNWELSKAINQAEVVGRTRASAGAEYIQNSAALNEAFAQQSMSDAMSLMQYKTQALRAAAATSAAGVGMVDRYINDYARQVGDMATIQSLNEGFRERQLSREQAGVVANYLNKYNSQDFYQMQEVVDPIAPFPPLPTLINPAPPSMVGSAPSAGAAFLGTAINAVGAGLNTYAGLKPK